MNVDVLKCVAMCVAECKQSNSGQVVQVLCSLFWNMLMFGMSGDVFLQHVANLKAEKLLKFVHSLQQLNRRCSEMCGDVCCSI